MEVRVQLGPADDLRYGMWSKVKRLVFVAPLEGVGVEKAESCTCKGDRPGGDSAITAEPTDAPEQQIRTFCSSYEKKSKKKEQSPHEYLFFNTSKILYSNFLALSYHTCSFV